MSLFGAGHSFFSLSFLSLFLSFSLFFVYSHTQFLSLFFPLSLLLSLLSLSLLSHTRTFLLAYPLSCLSLVHTDCVQHFASIEFWTQLVLLLLYPFAHLISSPIFSLMFSHSCFLTQLSAAVPKSPRQHNAAAVPQVRVQG